MAGERLPKAERDRFDAYERMRTACAWAYGEDHVERVERELRAADVKLDEWMLQRVCLIRRQQEILREG